MMQTIVCAILAAGGLAAASPPPVPRAAAIHFQSGTDLFRVYCASCHGTSAKGDGPIAGSLRVAPADLTLLARHNRGKFDAEKVRRRIDGRDVVKPHGDSDMPVWGDALKHAGEGYSEAKVKERIDALVDYLKTLQER